MKKRIIIKDDTSKEKLMKAIERFEKEYEVTVLKMVVKENHKYKLIEFDEDIVSVWSGNIYVFLNDIDFRHMRFEDAL